MNYKSEKKKKSPKKNRLGLKILITVVITLVFFILIAFFAGRTIASKGNEELRLEFYNLLSASPLKGCIGLIFDEENIPDITPVLPECINSSANGISVSEAAQADAILHIATEETSYSAHILAVKDPSRLYMGKSTFSKNYISEIKHLENASYAFSAADDRQLKLIVSGGEYSEDVNAEFFGITEGGILAFGSFEDFRENDDKLVWAQESIVHTLVKDSLPTSFSPSEHPMGAPSFSIGQCADGSLIIIISDKRASVNDLTKLFYKYSAVNAAIVYMGEAAGIIFPDGEALTFGNKFEEAQFSHSWLIK